MSTEIKPGTKVQIAHDPRHDWEREGPRREMNGQVGTVRTIVAGFDGKWPVLQRRL